MTQPTAADTADTQTDNGQTHWSLLFLMCLVAAFAGFASLYMSFHGLRDLVERAEGVDSTMSAIGPFGIDGLQLATLLAIIITVGARTKVRVYLWSVFFVSIAVSVGMNVVDAAERRAGAAGMILSGFWPALLAAATHVVVVAVRWWLESRRMATVETTLTVVEIGGSSVDAEAGEPSEPKSATPAQRRARARTLYQNGRSCKQVADVMTRSGAPVSEKQVERWTKDLRTAPVVSDISSPEPVAVS